MHTTRVEIANYNPKEGLSLKIFFSRFKNYLDPEQDISPFFHIILKGANIISQKVLVMHRLLNHF